MKLINSIIFGYMMVLLVSVEAMPLDEEVSLGSLQTDASAIRPPSLQESEIFYCSWEWHHWSTNETLWNDHLPEKDINATIGGILDVRSLAKTVADQGKDLPEYIGARLGNFSVSNKNGKVDLWRSLLFKLNALTAPILMAPYYIERTASNSEKWYDWWHSLQSLFPQGQKAANGRPMKGYCNPNATSYDYIPKSVSFPDNYMPRQIPMNEQFNTHPLDLRSSVWTMEDSRVRTAPSEFMARNTLNDCMEASYTYSESVAEQVTSTSSQQFSSSLKQSSEVSLSSKVSTKFMGIGASITASIKAGLEQTATRATTTSETVSQGTTRTVTYGPIKPQIPPSTLLNITMWADQVDADLYYTGDARWHDDYTGLQLYMQGHGKQYSGKGDIPSLISRNILTTPAKIKNVIRKVSDLLNADWDEVFIQNLVTASVRAKSKAKAGSSVLMDVYQCDLSSDPNIHRCDKETAVRYPVTDTCLKGILRTGANDFKVIPGVRMNVAPIDGLPIDCYDYELVDADLNRFKVHLRDDCNRENADIRRDVGKIFAH